MKERILELLAALGLKQTEFAKRLGVNKTIVSNWTIGRVEPSAGARTAICATFGVNRAWLDNGDGDMFTTASPTLENATFEELQLAYIRALIERLPPDIQARVLATIRLYVSEKNRRANEEAERRELSRLQAEIAEAQAAAQIEEKEREAQVARADWAARKSTGAIVYQSKVYGNVGNVDNLSVNQPPAPVEPTAPPVGESTDAAPDSKKAERDPMIERLEKIRAQKLKEAQEEEERSRNRGK